MKPLPGSWQGAFTVNNERAARTRKPPSEQKKNALREFLQSQKCACKFIQVQAFRRGYLAAIKSFNRGKTPGGVLDKFLYGKVPSRGPIPYPFIYHFSRKRYSFSIPLLT